MSQYVTVGRASETLRSIVKKTIRKNSDGNLLLTLSQSGTGELYLNTSKSETVEGLIKKTVFEER